MWPLIWLVGFGMHLLWDVTQEVAFLRRKLGHDMDQDLEQLSQGYQGIRRVGSEPGVIAVVRPH